MNPVRSPRPRPAHLRVVPDSRGRAVDPAPTWIEISLSWGTTPLQVEYLREPRDYVLDGGPAIVIERDGETFARVPDDANVTLVVDGRVFFRREAQRRSLLERDAAHPGAALFRLERGRRCRFEACGLVVQVEAVAGELAPPHLRPRLTRGDWAVLAISAALHLAALAALVVTTPSLP